MVTVTGLLQKVGLGVAEIDLIQIFVADVQTVKELVDLLGVLIGIVGAEQDTALPISVLSLSLASP